jgi:hypothetical protein
MRRARDRREAKSANAITVQADHVIASGGEHPPHLMITTFSDCQVGGFLTRGASSAGARGSFSPSRIRVPEAKSAASSRSADDPVLAR